jgi:hypothetical protein
LSGISKKPTAEPTAIERLRGISARILVGDDPDAEWFAEALARYEAGAPHGEQLDDSFGLKGSGWWLAEARRRRDDAIRGISRDFFAGEPSDRKRAIKIASAIRRYRASAWRQDKGELAPPSHYRGTLHERLFIVCKLGAVGLRAIQQIIGAGSKGCVCTGEGGWRLHTVPASFNRC